MAQIIAFPTDRARQRGRPSGDVDPARSREADVRELVLMPRLNLPRLCAIFDLDIDKFDPDYAERAPAEQREGGTPAA
ncbi:hypothetical protein [Salinarimonas chemoclinalis]|uniref:hypothetical protein n=1 Tax=Salinarimonas chemoclinalis TaxID=3241599 RepID=UPI003556B625